MSDQARQSALIPEVHVQALNSNLKSDHNQTLISFYCFKDHFELRTHSYRCYSPSQEFVGLL